MTSTELTKLFAQRRANNPFDAFPSKHTSVNDAQQAPSLVSEEEIEEVLKAFDLASRYGPCAGIPRIVRWERANRLGLNPPQIVKSYLDQHAGHQGSLWEGRL
mmetsp:Transcript_41576/g.79450  ORF Transcript_41576/g.79450 Transcript_41576/m.79450 type:complete len:103 (-) Transcript_41576:1426-1734(-)